MIVVKHKMLISWRMLIVMFGIRLINCLLVINKREKNLKQLLNRKYSCGLRLFYESIQ